MIISKDSTYWGTELCASFSIHYSLSLVRLAQHGDSVKRETISDRCDHTYKPA